MDLTEKGLRESEDNVKVSICFDLRSINAGLSKLLGTVCNYSITEYEGTKDDGRKYNSSNKPSLSINNNNMIK